MPDHDCDVRGELSVSSRGTLCGLSLDTFSLVLYESDVLMDLLVIKVMSLIVSASDVHDASPADV